MIRFLISPFLTLFSKRVYREGMTSGIGRALGYLFYLSFLWVLFFAVLVKLRFAPLVDQGFEEVLAQVPEMTLSQSGLSTEEAKRYVVEHALVPDPIMVIDTTKVIDALKNEGLKAPILVASDAVLVRNEQQLQERTLRFSEFAKNLPEPSQRGVRLTHDVFRDWYQKLRTFVIPITLLVTGAIFFLWKVTAALIYSVAALLLNLMAKEKSRYERLLSLSCYALTPVTILQFVNIFFLGSSLNLNVLVSVAITIVYLIFGLFFSGFKAEAAGGEAKKSP